MKTLIKEICKIEGKKSQTSIANVRETLAVLTDILAAETLAHFADHSQSIILTEFSDAVNKKIKKFNKKVKK